MKIATWNLRNFYDGGTFLDDKVSDAVPEEFFLRRVAYFTEVFRNQDIDIICLQEVGGERGIPMIGDALGYDYFIAKPNSRGIRMAVLYKKKYSTSITCKSVSLGEFAIPSIHTQGDTTVLPTISQRRDVLTIDITDAHGKKIQLITFHLKSLLPMYLEGEDRTSSSQTQTDAKFRCIFYKMMELRGLRAYADTVMNEGKEVVFLGDFNEHHKSSSIDILKSSANVEKMLEDVLADYKGDSATHIHRISRLTFDTILVSKGIYDEIENVTVENKELRAFNNYPVEEQVVESDHAMVVLTLK